MFKAFAKKCIGCDHESVPFNTKAYEEFNKGVHELYTYVYNTSIKEIENESADSQLPIKKQIKKMNEKFEKLSEQIQKAGVSFSIEELKQEAIKHINDCEKLPKKEQSIANIKFIASQADQTFELIRTKAYNSSITGPSYNIILDIINGKIPLVFPYTCVYTNLKARRDAKLAMRKDVKESAAKAIECIEKSSA